MSKSISVVIPCLTEEDWQAHLTNAVIRIARSTTQIRYQLIICEAVGQYFKPGQNPITSGLAEYTYLHNPKKGFANADMNRGMDMATGDIVVLLTNDVFVKPGWLDAMLACFDVPDCGMVSLGTSDHREIPMNIITEGLWCPLMALLNKPEFRFDAETFPSYWGDTDLVMRVYSNGYRAYRNRSVVCDHLGRATNTKQHPAGTNEEIEAAKGRFVARHQTSPLLIFRVLMDGLII